ncbi:MAG: flagellar protein FlaG [Gammaproteobacteria bacterium]|nr:flagellar protein FlaG [Gammaproteobacteria bacterium]
MNELVTQQLSQVAAGIVTHQGRQPSQAGRAVPAVTGIDKSHTKVDASEKRENDVQTADKLPEVVEELNAMLQEMNRSIRFSIDDDSGRIVVKVIDMTNDEVIRQIPSEDMMSLIRHVGDSQSLLFNEEA